MASHCRHVILLQVILCMQLLIPTPKWYPCLLWRRVPRLRQGCNSQREGSVKTVPIYLYIAAFFPVSVKALLVRWPYYVPHFSVELTLIATHNRALWGHVGPASCYIQRPPGNPQVEDGGNYLHTFPPPQELPPKWMFRLPIVTYLYSSSLLICRITFHLS